MVVMGSSGKLRMHTGADMREQRPPSAPVKLFSLGPSGNFVVVVRVAPPLGSVLQMPKQRNFVNSFINQAGPTLPDELNYLILYDGDVWLS